jgi:hypothetical protein
MHTDDYWDIAYETADDPSILGMAGHLLYLGTNDGT